MIRYMWLLATVVTALSTTPAPNSVDVQKWPRECNFTDSSVATCSSLQLERFDRQVEILKIVNPPLALFLESDFLQNLGLDTINMLVIENAVIQKIDNNAFRNLSVLEDIKIINSDVPYIHPDTFVSNINLKRLNFRGSNLQSFDNIKSESIEELDISNCSIRKISNINFDNLSELVYLNLAHNLIDQIELNTFSNVINLEQLDLSYNQISEIAPNLFANNMLLDILNLDHNPLKSFQISTVSEIEKLQLKSCNLTNINGTFDQNLNMLTYIDISGNKLSFLPSDTFSLLADLVHVDLSNNGMNKLDPSLFANNIELEKIILDNNNFGELVPFSCSMSQFSTEIFSCDNCQLRSLDEDTFATMPAIVKLRLSNNKLENFSATKLLRSLIELDLSKNKITTIPDNAFISNTALAVLNLSGNPLTTLDASVIAMGPVIMDLDVSFCDLKKLWTNQGQELHSLKQLNIANNKITAINQRDLDIVPNLKVLELAGNPLECDQTFCNFVQFLKDRDVAPTLSSTTGTHENLKDSAAEFEMATFFRWENVIAARCGYEEKCADDYDYYADDDLFIETNTNELGPIMNVEKTVIGETEVDIAEFKISDDSHFMGRYSYIWPALAFIFTATLVLLIVANVLLLVLKKRGTIQMPREGLPQIKIIPWSHSTKLKKHSGSVYQPLSEDLSGPRTPMINRYEQVPTTPAVHKGTP